MSNEPDMTGHDVESTETTIRCRCGVTVTAPTLAAAFSELWEHQEAAQAPIEESDR